MLKEIQIEKYLGLRDFSLEGLREINIISGPNGIGKTSVIGHVFKTENCLDSGRVVVDAPIAINQLKGRVIANLNGPHPQKFVNAILNVLGINFSFENVLDGDYVVDFHIQDLSIPEEERERIGLAFLGKGRLRMIEILVMLFDCYRTDSEEITMCIDNFEFGMDEQNMRLAVEWIFDFIEEFDLNVGKKLQFFITTHSKLLEQIFIEASDKIYGEGPDDMGASYRYNLVSTYNMQVESSNKTVSSRQELKDTVEIVKHLDMVESTECAKN